MVTITLKEKIEVNGKMTDKLKVSRLSDDGSVPAGLLGYWKKTEKGFIPISNVLGTSIDDEENKETIDVTVIDTRGEAKKEQIKI